MVALSLLSAAISPGLALLAYFYLKDRYESEPVSSVAKLFVLGLLVVFPVMVVQRGMVLGFGENPIFYAFIVAAGAEEFVKWFIVYHLVYRSKRIRHSYDGIVYATAVSLGFATMENVLYSLYFHPDFLHLLSRALLPVSGHALFGVVMGYYFGKARYDLFKEVRNVRLALIYPVLWHGMYDAIILLSGSNWIHLIVPFMALLWYRGLRKVNRAIGMPLLPDHAREDKVKFPANGQ
jgi:RsiW-degrading membrane proteinase PrsW (M82 family)